MITQSLIPEVLRSFKYYKNKLPLYLKQSKTFQEHFKIWYEVLVGDGSTGLVGNAEILLNMLNIFADDYFDFLETVEGSHKDDTTSDILDKIGNLFGVARYITVTYDVPNITPTETVTESLVLTNEEFLILIKARIIQNYCEGTRQQITEYYALMNLPIVVKTGSEPATAELYFILYDENSELSNTEKMFLAGLLKIQSMGINYRQQTYNDNLVLVWRPDSTELTQVGWEGVNGSITYKGGQWTI